MNTLKSFADKVEVEGFLIKKIKRNLSYFHLFQNIQDLFHLLITSKLKIFNVGLYQKFMFQLIEFSKCQPKHDLVPKKGFTAGRFYILSRLVNGTGGRAYFSVLLQGFNR